MTTEAVRRTFRRILSGDPQGTPPWVRALGEPGDAGWFGPDSEIWLVHSSLATLVGGVRALLLQTCHPLALAGVEQHSSYRTDPLGRLQRTNLFVTTTTFGSSTQAQAATASVRRVHQRVVGTAPDGRRYAATDPRLLMWVHLTLTDSMLVAAQTYHRAPVDADAYVADMAVVATAVGVVDPPTTQAQLKSALAGFEGEVAGSTVAREVSSFLQWPAAALPRPALPAYVVLARAATDLLPSWAHPILGTPDRSSVVRTLDTTTCRTMLRGLQAVLGPRSMAVTLAYQRLGLQPAARPH
ncbi:MAG: oxygenase MpaB family protein [Actinomycetes bacterium]